MQSSGYNTEMKYSEAPSRNIEYELFIILFKVV